MRKIDRVKKRLEPRIREWQKAFEDDETGINKTIADMLWQYAGIMSVTGIVRLANEKRDLAHPPLNEMVFTMIFDGYWVQLLLAIRRLLDKNSLRGAKGVYSLRAVLDDITACSPRITRRIYVEAICNAEYDLDTLEEAHEQLLIAASPEKKSVWADRRLIESRHAHKTFDFLSNTEPADRNENDLLDRSYLEKLKSRLEPLDNISEHVSVTLAHSGNALSRARSSIDNIDLRDARKYLKTLKEVADILGLWFCNTGSGDLAHFMGDVFEGLDTPLIASSDRKKLEDNWTVIDADIANWRLDPASLKDRE